MSLPPLIQTNFTAGELSERFGGRVDLAAYGNGLAEMLNFVPTVEGPALKRSGTVHVETARSDAARLIPFEFNVTQGYVIEAGNLAFRFYTNDVRIETSPGVAYELATPYPAAELAALDWHQSNDVMYLVSGLRQTRVLARTSATTFAIAAFETLGGPFKDANSDEAITVGASAATGSVTLTASGAIFAAGHVGGLFSMESGAFSDVPAWEPGITVALADKRRYEGRVYQANGLPTSGSRTGTSPPIHAEGSERDGMQSGVDINADAAGGVLWTYLYDRFAILKITGYTSPTQVTATVQRRLADVLVSGSTFRWAHGAFSDAEGWPSSVTIWNERLLFTKDNSLYASVVGDYANFAPRNRFGELTADQSLRFTLGDPNPIRWARADRQLLVGTANAEYLIGATSTQEAAAQGNLQAPRQSGYGSAAMRPVLAGARNLFVQKGGRKLREAGYDFNQDRYVASDITLRARHVSVGGFVELAYQAEPETLLWAVRGDGVLAALTFDQQQEVRGWSRHVLGGTAARALSVATITDPAGERSQLWILVSRTIAGAAVKHVERLERFWEDGEDALADAYFVDAGLRYTGAPATTISGLAHLAGETVTILADGATHPNKVVSGGGSVTLDRAAANVVIGLGYTARLRTMRIEGRQRGATSQGTLKRLLHLTLRFLDTLGVRVGSSSSSAFDELQTRSSASPMDSATPLYSGDLRAGVPGGWERDGQSIVESYQPLPAMIVSLMPEFKE